MIVDTPTSSHDIKPALIVFACCSLMLSTYTYAQESAGDENDLIDHIQIFGNRQALQTTPGSGFVITEADLEQYEFDDIHRVLQNVPGVYIREEDGYGLRPNIGLRGATSERSSKIALMEDSILLSPAPYSAPAAYYFPIVSRMTQLEVFKGPSAITYGPNTVGGAINMLSRQISAQPEGQIDIALGQQEYRKLHGFYRGKKDNVGYLVEGINLHSDGFKSLASGKDTGFSKNEFIGKISYEPENDVYNQHFELKLGYADEVSNETYLGLTDSDFAQDPYLRYAASQNDKLDWEHLQLQVSHYMELSGKLTLFTQAYRRDFNRDWDRLNGFNANRSISTILQSPQTGLNALFFEVLKGQRDSLTNDETLQFTLNDRTYFSQGIQTRLSWDHQYNDFDVTVDAGLRIHQDQVERLHRTRFFNMRNSELVLSGQSDAVSINNKDEVTAIAAYVRSKIQWQDLNASFGLRVEHIEGDATDFVTQSAQNNNDTVLLPGIGLFYQISPTFGLLAGVNKGFVPNSPGQTDNVDPEESWNYELGVRGNIANWQFETIGFYNDYSNLKGTCTFSSGCSTELDVEFNGGEVEIYGTEASARARINLFDGITMPIGIAYTYTQSEFQNSFLSNFSQWGNVTAGDELPYLPEQQANLQLAIEGDVWQFSLNYKYVAEMAEAAGTSTELEDVKSSAISVIDISAWYQWSQALRIYTKLDNLTDESDIVSRRPFGARPGKPRQFILGAKYAF